MISTRSMSTRHPCWDCSLVNEEQQIYVEKSEDVHGLFGHAKHSLLIR